MTKAWKKALLVSLLLSALLLGGCGKIELGTDEAGEHLRFSKKTETLSAIVTAEELPLLEQLPLLREADLSGSDCYAEMLAWQQAHPEVTLRYTVLLPDGRSVLNDVTELDCADLQREQVASLADCLRFLPALRTLSLGGTGENALLGEDRDSLAAVRPDIEYLYTLRYRGADLPAGTQVLDFRDASEEDLTPLLPWLSQLQKVRTVELGEIGEASEPRLNWELIHAIREALPHADLHGSFTLWGRELDLSAEELDFNHIKMDDQGALVKAVCVCMPKLRVLDMDFCGVDDEHMAEIRDALPETEVIWRVWFGEGYSVRTNVERILASNPDKAGELMPENTVSLQYCTKVKYLDLGHNSYLGSIDFCACMPELEVIIVAMGDWSSCAALANCPKLEYAELQTSSLNDLRPLAGLKNLRHLNICYDFALHDITPLYDLELERLWIGCLTPIPVEQIETYKRLHPNCTVDVDSYDPTQTYWRYLGQDETGHLIRDPRYLLLREQFDYDNAPYCYSYIENDPLYRRHK